jgi:cytoskeletal protein CcmA (bactofilin family)
MSYRRLAVLLTLALALVPTTLLAQATDEQGGLLLRINGNLAVAAGESADALVVINGDAAVAGSLTGPLVVVNGDAVVDGSVTETITVVNGTLDLRDTARVDGDVILVNSELSQAPGAVVTGEIQRESGLRFTWGTGGFVWFTILAWLAFTIVVLVAGLLFAAVGGRQLSTAAGLITSRPGETVLAAVLVWVLLPILAVLFFFTLVGIPLGLAVLLILLPALWFLGYLVAGTRLGAALLTAGNRPAERSHPYFAALIGLLVLQLLLFVPAIGGLIAFLAGLIGAGALVYLAWNAARTGRGALTEPERA